MSDPAGNRNISSFRRMPFIAAGEPRDVADLPIQDEAAPSPPEAMAPAVGSPHFIGPPPPPQAARTKSKFGWQWGLIGFGLIAAAGYGGLKLYQGRQTAAPAAVVTSPHPVLNSSAALSAPRDAATRPPQAPAAEPAPAKLDAPASPRAPTPAWSEGSPQAPAVRAASPKVEAPAPATRAPAPAWSEASPQAPAAEPEPAKLEAPASLRVPAPARSEGPQPAAQPEAAPDPAPGSAPAPAAPSRPSATDIMTASRKIVASPMMGDDERQVLDLMQATNSIVLQVKHQVDDIGKKMRDMQAQLDDMKRMVSLSQAKLLSGATQIAMGNMQPAPQAPPTADPQSIAAVTPDMGPACRLKPAYIVASASPAHATLKSGGQVFISVRAPSRDNPQGDSVPCFGRVLKITQEGSRWVVMTDRDVIGRN